MAPRPMPETLVMELECWQKRHNPKRRTHGAPERSIRKALRTFNRCGFRPVTMTAWCLAVLGMALAVMGMVSVA